MSGPARIARGFVVLAFAAAGGGKLLGFAPLIENFARRGAPPWAPYAVGLLEIALAAALFAPALRRAAAIAAAVVTAGAFGLHVVAGEWVAAPVPAAVCLAAAVTAGANEGGWHPPKKGVS